MIPSPRLQSALRWCRFPLIIFGVLSLGYYGYVWLDAKLYQDYESRKFDQALKSLAASNAGSEKIQPPLPNPGPLKTESAKTESRGAARSDGLSSGRIEISSIGLAVMILEGSDARTLRHGVGHILGTPLPGEQGNSAFAGHRDTFFRPLRNLRLNAEITLTTLKGVYHYRVDSMELVLPDDTSVLHNSEDDILTLVTCYPFNYLGSAPKRFIVRAHLVTG